MLLMTAFRGLSGIPVRLGNAHLLTIHAAIMVRSWLWIATKQAPAPTALTNRVGIALKVRTSSWTAGSFCCTADSSAGWRRMLSTKKRTIFRRSSFVPWDITFRKSWWNSRTVSRSSSGGVTRSSIDLYPIPWRHYRSAVNWGHNRSAGTEGKIQVDAAVRARHNDISSGSWN